MNIKKYDSIFKNLVISIVFLITTNAYCQNLDTTIVKTVILGENDIVCLSNPGLNVDINTWDKNELKIEYQLSVEAKTEEILEEFYNAYDERLNDQLNGAKSGKIFTNVQFSNFTRNNNKIKLKLKGDNNEYNLEKFEGSIVIYMPKNNSLDAQSSFHKLDIEDINADATIEISSTSFTMGDCRKLNIKSSFSKNMKIGKAESAIMKLQSSDIEMEAIATDLSLTSSFSNIEIGSIGNKAEINLNSSSFETGDIASIDLSGSFIRSFKANNIGDARIGLNSSKFEAKKISSVEISKVSFSTLKIDQIDEIDIDVSSSSKFYFESINSIKASNCSFSDFEIGNLTKLFMLSAKSGNVVIRNVEKGFDKIDINGTFITTNIHTAQGSEYLINADLRFPNYDFGDINIKNHSKDMSHEVINGWKGSNHNVSSIINLICQNCKTTVN